VVTPARRIERADVLGEAVAPAPVADLVHVVERYRRAIARDEGRPGRKVPQVGHAEAI
jgi:hypothetical protein